MSKLTSEQRRVALYIDKTHIFKRRGRWMLNAQFGRNETHSEELQAEENVRVASQFINKLNNGLGNIDHETSS